ncbi:MAG: hypothetical protein JNL74_03505 [Fibrobacteres bacterium]|nr:hypothetical protein [Fibrobacterota bacterium]
MKKNAFVVLLLHVIVTCAGAQTMVTPNPLASLPSSEGSTVKSIKAMQSKTFLVLGSPEADPKWGRAYGSAYSEKSLIYSPRLRGFFRAGEGDHANVKADGYGQDDYWFYDINANKWICLYPGTDTRNFNKLVLNGSISVDSLGRAVDTTGQPVPGHQLIHSWGLLTYDTDRDKFWFLSDNQFLRYYMPGLTLIEQGLQTLEAAGLNQSKGRNFCPWAYDANTGRFERDLTSDNGAMPSVGDIPQFLYISSIQKMFACGNLGVAFFDPLQKKWSALSKDATYPKDWTYDFGACYDSKRNRVYMGQSADNLYYYSIENDKWTKVNNTNSIAVRFRSVYGAIEYDSKNDVVLVFSWGKDGLNHQVFPLDPKTNTWGEPINFKGATVPYPMYGVGYDSELGVVFIFTAGDSRDNGVMGAFCYKNIHVNAEIRSEKSTDASISVVSSFTKSIAQFSIKGFSRDVGILKIFDIDGKLLMAKNIDISSYKVSIDVRKFASGYHLATIDDGVNQARVKFLVLR